MTGAERWVRVGGRTTAAGAQEGAGTGTGYWAGDWARSQAQVLLKELLREVPALPQDFGTAVAAAVEGENPAQLHLEAGSKARGQVQGLECVWAVGERLAEPRTAEVLEGGWGVAGTDHLHAAFGRCGTHHGVELLVLQLGGSDAC